MWSSIFRKRFRCYKQSIRTNETSTYWFRDFPKIIFEYLKVFTLCYIYIALAVSSIILVAILLDQRRKKEETKSRFCLLFFIEYGIFRYDQDILEKFHPPFNFDIQTSSKSVSNLTYSIYSLVWIISNLHRCPIHQSIRNSSRFRSWSFSIFL